MPNEKPQPETTYHVLFNERQRVLFVLALKVAALDPATVEVLIQIPGEERNATALEELLLMLEILSDIPNVERESPGALHGLCL